ncbi:MAG: glycosyltransferase family 4 protein [Gammaproteobacteria bacterium]|nr:glycosyltransferase family 4 protein [Gammaproteobacteria bacterium]MCW8986414.1 glycosyltransferase family 4 protein [Gammaproteobacteria bacterium]
MKKLLIIGYVWPEPNSSAAGSRMIQLIHIFQKQDYSVTYASPAVISEHMINLEDLGIDKVSIELNNSSFDDYVKRLNPDVVLFDRFMMEEQFSWRVEKQCPSALRLLETVDLHCLRYARQLAVKNGKDAFNITNLDFINDIALREVASILRCDLSILISEYEVDVLKTIYHVNEEILLYLPFMYEAIDYDEAIKKRPAFPERENFVTIGNFRHEPNWDSVLYLKNVIWPRVKAKLKHSELHIYGSYPPKKAQELNNPKQGFYVKGWAANVLDTLSQYRICLSPLRFGAGMKGKLADAMLSGTPSVTTSIGAESMFAEFNWPGIIADEPSAIAEAAVDLYNNQKKWQQCQRNGISIVNSVFSKKKNEEKFVKKLEAVITSLEKNRRNNFTGMMLRHHTMKSAMYMSQWIEEKNKFK